MDTGEDPPYLYMNLGQIAEFPLYYLKRLESRILPPDHFP